MKPVSRSQLYRWLRVAISLWLMAPGGVFVPAPARADVPSDSFTLLVRPADSWPPDPVADLTAIANSGTEGEVSLSWTSPDEDDIAMPSGDPVSSYDVRYATFSADSLGPDTTAWWGLAQTVSGEPSPQSPGNLEGLILNGLEPGATLWFAIRSTDDSSNVSPIDSKTSTPGQQAQAAVTDLPPPAPANLAATPGSGQVTLTWNAVSASDLDFYRLYVDSTSPYDFGNAFVATNTASLSYLHAGLTDGASYYYRVTAVDRGAPVYRGLALESAPSNTVSAVPGALLPAAPTLAHDASQLGTTQIRWLLTDNAANETALYVYRAPNTRISPNLGPLSGTGGTTGYLETGFTPNAAVTRYGEAFNLQGSSFSASLTVYTQADPPASSQFVAVASTTLSLSWNGQGNPAGTVYQVQYDNNAAFTNPFAVSGAALSATLSNLTPNTHYWVRVRAQNGDGVFTAFDVTLSTKTAKPDDTIPPKAPIGIWAEWGSGGAGQLMLHWREVLQNVDGTSFNDPAPEPYRIYRTESLTLDGASPAPKVWDINPVGTSSRDAFGPNAMDTLEADKVYYFRVRAVDAAGNESGDSMLVEAKGDGTLLNVVALADDLRSRLAVPVAAARRLLLKENNGYGDDLILKAVRVPDEEKGKVIKSIRFEAYSAATGQLVKNFAMKSHLGDVVVVYDVQNGQVMQGAPAAPGQAGNGAPVFDASQAKNQLSLFWHNGVEWVKVGGSVESGSQEVRMRSSRLGRYQIRQAIRIGPISLTRVYPRVFSPNDDGWNDKVIFEFDNPGLLPVKGEIFDVTGAKVADMAPGPNPDASLVWDGKSGGQAVPAGIYIYQIEVAGETANGTVVVAK